MHINCTPNFKIKKITVILVAEPSANAYRIHTECIPNTDRLYTECIPGEYIQADLSCCHSVRVRCGFSAHSVCIRYVIGTAVKCLFVFGLHSVCIRCGFSAHSVCNRYVIGTAVKCLFVFGVHSVCIRCLHTEYIPNTYRRPTEFYGF